MVSPRLLYWGTRKLKKKETKTEYQNCKLISISISTSNPISAYFKANWKTVSGPSSRLSDEI